MSSGAAADYQRQFVELAEEMINAWSGVRAPAPIRLPDDSRASLSEVGAVAVAWGWTARVVRTAQSALLLHREGFDIEAAPLLRSMLEHAIAIFWVADKRGAAYQALARDRAAAWARFDRAQANGWTLEGEAADLLRRAMTVETDPHTLSEDTYLATAHRAVEYGLGQFYQGWLIETWSTHATLMSAEPYFDQDERRLYRVAPDQHKQVPQTVVLALHAAFTGYEQITENALGGQLAAWEARAISLLEQGASDKDLSS